eukprot:TRINITY_DN92826_c0_g1_i1.p1 TRINITY_DN92826_c0_g1~~TRINITY_DN92826_c0_g1_i1.p1  ORF type:complete len:341 (+),score=49.65 TRINITY_DN92826_c0_g1_i1:116-1138(+)
MQRRRSLASTAATRTFLNIDSRWLLRQRSACRAVCMLAGVTCLLVADLPHRLTGAFTAAWQLPDDLQRLRPELLPPWQPAAPPVGFPGRVAVAACKQTGRLPTELQPWVQGLPQQRGLPRQARSSLAATDPNFQANVGQAIDDLRDDHARLPVATPGLSVARPDVILEIAQIPSLRFAGIDQYMGFWDNFRTGVQLVSTTARSEVVEVVHSGLYIRIRWRLILQPRNPAAGNEAAAAALQAAGGFLGQAAAAAQQSGSRSQGSGFGGWLQNAGDGLLGEAEKWAGSAPQATQERTVELNSIYELDCWTGRVARHTLEFRSPSEDFGLLGALQGVPNPSFR